MAYRNGPKIVTDGLVLCLDAAISKSYPGSGTTWYDLSTSKINGTLTNGPVFNSANRGYFSFDGTNDKVLISDVDIDYTADFTISCWVYAHSSTASDNTYRGFLKFGNDNESSDILTLIKWRSGIGNGFVVDYNTGGDRYVITTNSTLPNPNARAAYPGTDYVLTGKWSYLTVSISGTDLNLYINDQIYDTVSLSGATRWSGIKDLHIGGFVVSVYNYYWKGDIPTTMIHDRALTSDEITQNFNATKGRFGV
jgi:hypothetical protein